MSKPIKFTPDFMNEIGRHLATVVDGTKRRGIYEKALNRAGGVVVGAMMSRVPVGDKSHNKGKKPLQQTLGMRVKPFSNGNYFLIVGAKYPAGAHAHLVESGHEIVISRGLRKGQKTGLRAVAKPFMAPAVDSSKSRTERALIQTLIQGIKENDG